MKKNQECNQISSLERRMDNLEDSISAIKQMLVDRINADSDEERYERNSEQDRIIADVLETFDFRKMHKVMEFLDWRWASKNEVPSVADLKNETVNLINDCFSQLKRQSCDAEGRDEMTIATGGLDVSVWKDDDGEYHADVKFNAVETTV